MTRAVLRPGYATHLNLDPDTIYDHEGHLNSIAPHLP